MQYNACTARAGLSQVDAATRPPAHATCHWHMHMHGMRAARKTSKRTLRRRSRLQHAPIGAQALPRRTYCPERSTCLVPLARPASSLTVFNVFRQHRGADRQRGTARSTLGTADARQSRCAARLCFLSDVVAACHAARQTRPTQQRATSGGRPYRPDAPPASPILRRARALLRRCDVRRLASAPHGAAPQAAIAPHGMPAKGATRRLAATRAPPFLQRRSGPRRVRCRKVRSAAHRANLVPHACADCPKL